MGGKTSTGPQIEEFCRGGSDSRSAERKGNYPERYSAGRTDYQRIDMDIKEVKTINTTALAYLGDAVYEVAVRRFIMETGQHNAAEHCAVNTFQDTIDLAQGILLSRSGRHRRYRESRLPDRPQIISLLYHYAAEIARRRRKAGRRGGRFPFPGRFSPRSVRPDPAAKRDFTVKKHRLPSNQTIHFL